jgi:hypothetical protein
VPDGGALFAAALVYGAKAGRVWTCNLGLVVFTVFSVLLAVTWLHGTAGALWLIVMRVL